MGTKGRDLFLWIYFISAGAWIIEQLAGHNSPASLVLFIISGIGITVYPVYLRRARYLSRQIGLQNVVLLPVPVWWASILIRFSSGGKLNSRPRRAFETHIETPAGIDTGRFLALLDSDLKLAEKQFPKSLFMWETSAPLPARIRAMIKRKKPVGEAYWAKGGWIIPRFPFTGKDLRKGTVRRGFIITDLGRRDFLQ